MRILYFSDGSPNPNFMFFVGEQGKSYEDVKKIDITKLWKRTLLVLQGDIMVVGTGMMDVKDYLQSTYKGVKVYVV